MAHSILKRKTEENLTVSEKANKLFQVIYQEQIDTGAEEEDVPKIKVSTLISKMSFYYEKIRNVVDYKEEHLLRKNAIERILRRQIIIEAAIKKSRSEEIARHLLTELIRAAYLPNNKVPEYKIDDLSAVIAKYIGLKNACAAVWKDDAEFKNASARWIIELAASDIEERLGRSRTTETVIESMYEILDRIIKLPDNSPFERDREIQIYIGIHRSYLKFDRAMLSYIVFKYYTPNWQQADEPDVERIARNLKAVKAAVDEQVSHPLTRQLNRIISRYTVFFTVLTDVVDDNPVSVYRGFRDDPKAFPRQIKIKCQERYRRTKSKLWRAAVRSIFYIFLTKSIFAIFLEVPAIRWFGESVNPFSLAVNVTFPALLLFLIVFFTKLPSEDNTKKIVEGIEEIVFNERERRDPYRLHTPPRRSGLVNAVFGIIYAITFFLSFGFVVWALMRLNFNVISIIIFLFFLALVSFFSIRIRKNARELIIVEPRESILSLFSDFFYTPIVASGKWLSEKFSRINVFVFVLDFIIEAPFKIFVEIAEEWTKYVRERRDEIM